MKMKVLLLGLFIACSAIEQDVSDLIYNHPNAKVSDDGFEVTMPKAELDELRRQHANHFTHITDNHMKYLTPQLGIDGRGRRHAHIIDPVEKLHTYGNLDIKHNPKAHHTFAFHDDDIVAVECTRNNEDGDKINRVALVHESNALAEARLAEMKQFKKAFLTDEKQTDCAFADTPMTREGQYRMSQPGNLMRQVKTENCYVDDYTVICDNTDHMQHHESWGDGMMDVKVGHMDNHGSERPTPKLQLDLDGNPTGDHADAEIIFMPGKHGDEGTPVLELEDPFLGFFCEYVDCNGWSFDEIEQVHEKVVANILAAPKAADRFDSLEERYGADGVRAPRRRMMEKRAKLDTHADAYSANEGWFFNPKKNMMEPNFYHQKARAMLAEKDIHPETAHAYWHNKHKQFERRPRERLFSTGNKENTSYAGKDENRMNMPLRRQRRKDRRRMFSFWSGGWWESAGNAVVNTVESAWDGIVEGATFIANGVNVVAGAVGDWIESAAGVIYTGLMWLTGQEVDLEWWDVALIDFDLADYVNHNYSWTISQNGFSNSDALGPCEASCGGNSWSPDASSGGGGITITLACNRFDSWNNNKCRIAFYLGFNFYVRVSDWIQIRELIFEIYAYVDIDFRFVLNINGCGQCVIDLPDQKPYTAGVIYVIPYVVDLEWDFQIQVAIQLEVQVGFDWYADGAVGVDLYEGDLQWIHWFQQHEPESMASLDIQYGRVTLSFPFIAKLKFFGVAGPFVIYEPFVQIIYDPNQNDYDATRLGFGYWIKAGVTIEFSFEWGPVSIDGPSWNIDWTLLQLEYIYGLESGIWYDPTITFLPNCGGGATAANGFTLTDCDFAPTWHDGGTGWGESFNDFIGELTTGAIEAAGVVLNAAAGFIYENSFDAGWGPCSTYAPGGYNRNWCQWDYSYALGLYAYEACSQCAGWNGRRLMDEDKLPPMGPRVGGRRLEDGSFTFEVYNKPGETKPEDLPAQKELFGKVAKISQDSRCEKFVAGDVKTELIGSYLDISEEDGTIQTKLVYVVEQNVNEGKNFGAKICRSRELYVAYAEGDYIVVDLFDAEARDAVFDGLFGDYEDVYTEFFEEWYAKWAQKDGGELTEDKIADFDARFELKEAIKTYLEGKAYEQAFDDVVEQLYSYVNIDIEGELEVSAEEVKSYAIGELFDKLPSDYGFDVEIDVVQGETVTDSEGITATTFAVGFIVGESEEAKKDPKFKAGKEIQNAQWYLNQAIKEAAEAKEEIADEKFAAAVKLGVSPDKLKFGYLTGGAQSGIKNQLINNKFAELVGDGSFKTLFDEYFYSYCGDSYAKDGSGSANGAFAQGWIGKQIGQDPNSLGAILLEQKVGPKDPQCLRAYVAYKPIPEPDFENRGPLVGDAEKAKDQILPQGGFVNCFTQKGGATSTYSAENCGQCQQVLDIECGAEDPHCGIFADWQSVSMYSNVDEDNQCTAVQYTRFDATFQCVSQGEDGAYRLCGKPAAFTADGEGCGAPQGNAQTPNFPDEEDAGKCTWTANIEGYLKGDVLLKNGGASKNNVLYIKQVDADIETFIDSADAFREALDNDDDGIYLFPGDQIVWNGAGASKGFFFEIDGGFEEFGGFEVSQDLDLITLGAVGAEDDGYDGYGYGYEDCDEAPAKECGCGFVGVDTDVNVGFLCQTFDGTVCYNQVNDWCSTDEEICETPKNY